MLDRDPEQAKIEGEAQYRAGADAERNTDRKSPASDSAGGHPVKKQYDFRALTQHRKRDDGEQQGQRTGARFHRAADGPHVFGQLASM